MSSCQPQCIWSLLHGHVVPFLQSFQFLYTGVSCFVRPTGKCILPAPPCLPHRTPLAATQSNDTLPHRVAGDKNARTRVLSCCCSCICMMLCADTLYANPSVCCVAYAVCRVPYGGTPWYSMVRIPTEVLTDDFNYGYGIFDIMSWHIVAVYCPSRTHHRVVCQHGRIRSLSKQSTVLCTQAKNRTT